LYSSIDAFNPLKGSILVGTLSNAKLRKLGNFSRDLGRTISDFETYLTFRGGLFTVEDSNKVTFKLMERAAPSEYRVLRVLKDGPQTHSEILSKLQTVKKPDSKMSSDRLYQVLGKLAQKSLVKKPDSRGGHWTCDL
jgi:hypothetical protein